MFDLMGVVQKFSAQLDPASSSPLGYSSHAILLLDISNDFSSFILLRSCTLSSPCRLLSNSMKVEGVPVILGRLFVRFHDKINSEVATL